MQKIIISYAQRIIDGIFVGNARAPYETMFMKCNKISCIINCSALEIPTPPCYKSLTFNWHDDDNQKIIDIRVVEQIFSFVEDVQQLGESVLFYCLEGQGRCLVAIAGYLMFKFSWSLYKVFQLLNSKRSDFELRSNFLSQLIELERILGRNKILSRDWKEKTSNQEIIVIQNTFLNQTNLKNYALNSESTNKQIQKKDQKVTWSNQWSEQVEEDDKDGLNFVTNNSFVKPILKIQKKESQFHKGSYKQAQTTKQELKSVENYIAQNLIQPINLQNKRDNNSSPFQKFHSRQSQTPEPQQTLRSRVISQRDNRNHFRNHSSLTKDYQDVSLDTKTFVCKSNRASPSRQTSQSRKHSATIPPSTNTMVQRLFNLNSINPYPQEKVFPSRRVKQFKIYNL